MGAQRRIVPLDDLILSGFKKKLQNVFEAPVVLSNSSDAIQAVRKAYSENETVKYPFIIVSMSSVAVGTTWYRPATLLRRGITVDFTDDFRMAYKATLIPTDTVYEVKCFHSDFSKLVEFSKAWMFTAIGGWLKFTVQYGRTAIDIHVKLAEEISLPTREGDTTSLGEYVLTGTANIFGYSSRVTLREQQLFDKIEIERYLVGLSSNPETQTMKFPSATSSWTDLDSGLGKTPEQILAMLLSIDGTGSTLDADTLDGLQSTAFALTNHQHDAESDYITNVDQVSASLIYVGDALPGTPTSTAGWRIKRVVIDGAGNVEVRYAGTSTNFSFIWDNRTNYAYA